MTKEEGILDALAWAQLKEPARVAKIASGLVRNTTSHNRSVTKTAIHDAVRATMPPHGRGKAICEAVAKEFDRQQPIWLKRQEEKNLWERHLAHQQALSTRINDAYAARFGRPTHTSARAFPGSWGEENYYENRQRWEKEEADRDKGDNCSHILIYQETYTVALLQSASKRPGYHYIAVRHRDGREPQYTSLREKCENFVEAVVSLGGPRVRAAISQGCKVVTDWVGRSSTIHYHDGKSVVLPWLATEFRVDKTHNGYHGHSRPVKVLGDQVTDDTDEEVERGLKEVSTYLVGTAV